MSNVVSLFRETTIEFSATSQKEALEWMRDHDLKPADVIDLTMKVNVDIDLAEIDDNDIIDEHDRRFGPGQDAIDRMQRAAAEGDCAEVLNILHREFGLAPPSHAQALANLLSPKGKAHV